MDGFLDFVCFLVVDGVFGVVVSYHFWRYKESGWGG